MPPPDLKGKPTRPACGAQLASGRVEQRHEAVVLRIRGPFGVVEAIWAIIAVRRWQRRIGNANVTA
jgi:hypothetical protein